jgi:hypothetical protein
MILTDNFIYIHNPKTGGTFVTKMLGKLLANQGRRRSSRWLGLATGSTHSGLIKTREDHDNCCDIPLMFRNKPIFSTIRNPYDRYVSLYEFASWKAYPERFYQIEEVKKVYPHFPNLSFAEHVKLVNSLPLRRDFNLPKSYNKNIAGAHTCFFIQMFFKQSVEQTLTKMEKNYIQSQQFKQDMFPVKFIKTENLNQELYDILIELGYERDRVKFILESGKILPNSPVKGNQRRQAKWEKYYTPELKAFVREKEDLLFTLFPEYDV